MADKDGKSNIQKTTCDCEVKSGAKCESVQCGCGWRAGQCLFSLLDSSLLATS